MTNVNLRLLCLSLLAGATTAALAAGAQTTSPSTGSSGTSSGATTHRSTAATHHPATHTAAHPAARSECVTVPGLSPKIPALPPGSPCPKALFTISERVDTMSPMVGPSVREGFSNLPMTFTLAYVDARVGTGELAKPHMFYTVQYTGYLPDGTKFDSSYDHPENKNGFSFPYGGHRVIPGWDTGFEGMHLGGKRRLFVPYELGYGERGRGPIPAKAELIFDMELISQSADAPPSATPPVAPNTPGSPATPNGAPATPSQPATQPGSQPGLQPGSRPGSLPATPPTSVPPSSHPPVGSDARPTPPSTGVPLNSPTSPSSTPPSSTPQR